MYCKSVWLGLHLHIWLKGKNYSSWPFQLKYWGYILLKCFAILFQVLMILRDSSGCVVSKESSILLLRDRILKTNTLNLTFPEIGNITIITNILSSTSPLNVDHLETFTKWKYNLKKIIYPTLTSTKIVMQSSREFFGVFALLWALYWFQVGVVAVLSW